LPSKRVLTTMKKLLLIASLAILGTTSSLQAQNSCGTDHDFAEKARKYPELIEARKKFDAGFKEFLKTYKPSTGLNKNGSAPKYIIPVVVHVLHDNGQENISDAQIKSEIDFLNLSFRNLVSDSVNRRQDTFKGTFYSYKELAADAEIEFRLAKKDPQGNCTNGIVRVQTPLTNKGNDELKPISVWDSKRYYNIWVVRGINKGNSVGVAGYAQFPMGFSGGASTDGIMVIHQEFGNIGTSQAGQTPNVTTSTHETGHWLGLYHPFQTQIDTCELNGDEILDTPPTNFSATSNEPLRNRCSNKNFNTCTLDVPDLPDMQENYMDYFIGDCASNMFTKQQVARMHYVLETYRTGLWNEENLVATGLNDATPSNCDPIAAFNAAAKTACAGNSILFNDFSYNTTISSYKWTFNGGTPATSTVKRPTVKYDNPGVYDVTLEVTGANGKTNAVTLKNYITIQDNTAKPKGFYTVDWWYQNNWQEQGWSFDYESPNRKFERTTAASYNQNASMFLPKDPFNQLMTVGTIASLISPSFDFSGISNGYFAFSYAFAQGRLPSSIGGGATNEEIKVYVSTDCGKSWTPKTTIGSSAISTIGNNASSILANSVNFVPADQGKWKDVVVSGATIPNNANVKFKIDFKYQGGNNFFLDNVRLGSSTGNAELMSDELKLSVQPNPFASTTKLNYYLNNNKQVDIRIIDITGKEIASLFSGQQRAGTQEIEIGKSQLQLSSGIYFVSLNIEGQKFSKKIVVE